MERLSFPGLQELYNVTPLAFSTPSSLEQQRQRHPRSTGLVLEGKEIGAGNFGTVFKAKYNFLPCVVKVLHPKFQGGALREAVYKECARLSSIRHPNIVQFLDVQDYFPPSPGPDGQPLISLIMELMDENLTAFLSRHRRAGMVPWHTIVNICHDVVLALHYLHARSIAYCILSSNNVLLLNGRAKISDLGVSRLQASRNESSAYAAPEVQRNRTSLQSDVFSFGVLLIQVITLKYPEPKFVLTHDQSSGSLAMATELSRRKADIALIPKRHKLRATALYCISESEHARPTTAELCNDFEVLKKKREYKKSSENKKSSEKKKHRAYSSSSSDDENTSSSTTSDNSDSTESESESESD